MLKHSAAITNSLIKLFLILKEQFKYFVCNLHHPAVVLLLFSGINLLFSFVIQVILARQLQLEDYGYLVTVIAIALLAASLGNAGVPGFLLRVFGAEGHFAKRWLKKSYLLVYFFVLLCFVFVPVLAKIDRDSLTFFMFMSVLLGQVISDLVVAKLQIESSYWRLACWQSLLNVARLVLFASYLVFVDEMTVQAAMTGFILSSLFLSLIGIWLLFQGVSPYKVTKTKTGAPDLGSFTFSNICMQSLPFAASGFLYLIYFQSDIILIKYLIGDINAGIYNVAFVVIAAIYLFPSVLYQRFLLPKLHYWSANDYEQYIAVYKAGVKLMAVFGGVLMCITLFSAPLLIPFVFGEQYEEAIFVLQILAIGIPFRFMASSATGLMVQHEAMKKKIWFMFIVALLNIMLNLLLIPLYGIEAAAFTTVFSEFLLFYFFLQYIKTKHSAI